MEKEISFFDEEGFAVCYDLPARYNICWRCEGHGKHLTPSIGEHAYTQEEFESSFSDEEERSEYFTRGGRYDVVCYICNGERVLLEIDEDAIKFLGSDEQKRIFADYKRHEREAAAYNRACEMERKMGA
jgi:hypothetical protein